MSAFQSFDEIRSWISTTKLGPISWFDMLTPDWPPDSTRRCQQLLYYLMILPVRKSYRQKKPTYILEHEYLGISYSCKQQFSYILLFIKQQWISK